ncbi:MAG: TerB family tellurite resistance protein [Acidisphaera sp.]|nr:TerB family tellurite resistance protein [Acidisphaera sp.]
MSYWGKIIGGVAGFVMGGPFGAVVGATLGHAADNGALPGGGMSFGGAPFGAFGPAKLAALLGGRDQLFAVGVVVLSAKLAKCDGPVVRAEIDAFRRQFRIPPENLRDIGRLFDQARDSSDGYESYANQLGAAFADSRGVLEDVLTALFVIARADRPVNAPELEFLAGVHRGFGLDRTAWQRARAGVPRERVSDEPDAYAVLGTTRGASDEAIRQAWLKLVRENHPDSLAARGVPAEFIARASEKVARINAAWDRIKRERRL